MSPFVIFVIVLTIIYIIYYAVMITRDLYGKKEDHKTQEEVFDVSDMVEEEAAVSVHESDNGFSVADKEYETLNLQNVYNENTVSKDINVFLHSYIEPNDLKQLERYSALLINLGLMREIEKGVYRFQEIDTDSIPDVVILYALCDIKGEDKLLSFDKIQELSLLFCIPIASFLDKVRHIAEVYSDYITYSDNSGIRNIYFKDNIESIHLLDMYYNHEI